MLPRWTTPAAQDLYNIVRRIQQDNPDAAAKVAKTLYDGCGGLGSFPRRGRKGRIEGTRELVFASLTLHRCLSHSRSGSGDPAHISRRTRLALNVEGTGGPL
jgi:plasmid stabilization system protein ParE